MATTPLLTVTNTRDKWAAEAQHMRSSLGREDHWRGRCCGRRNKGENVDRSRAYCLWSLAVNCEIGFIILRQYIVFMGVQVWIKSKIPVICETPTVFLRLDMLLDLSLKNDQHSRHFQCIRQSITTYEIHKAANFLMFLNTFIMPQSQQYNFQSNVHVARQCNWFVRITVN